MQVLVTFLEREGRDKAEKGGGVEEGRSTIKCLEKDNDSHVISACTVP